MTAARSFRLTAPVLAVLAISSATFAQEFPADPWQLVPPLPTTCFVHDGFRESLAAATEALNVAVARQNEVNAAARETFDDMDMGEKARRMQAFMMKSPQEAMKMMQAEQAAGALAQENIVKADEANARLESELSSLQDEFRAAAAEAVKPARARQQQLIAAKTVEVGEAAIAMFTSAADHAQYLKLVEEENAAYAEACAPYFGEAGSFHEWASRYRTEVVETLVAHDGPGEGMMIMQMRAMGLPDGGYRSTATAQQVNNFMTRVGQVWDIREPKAEPRVELRK